MRDFRKFKPFFVQVVHSVRMVLVGGGGGGGDGDGGGGGGAGAGVVLVLLLWLLLLPCLALAYLARQGLDCIDYVEPYFEVVVSI